MNDAHRRTRKKNLLIIAMIIMQTVLKGDDELTCHLDVTQSCQTERHTLYLLSQWFTGAHTAATIKSFYSLHAIRMFFYVVIWWCCLLQQP